MSGDMPPDTLASDLGGGLPAQFGVRPDVVVVMPTGVKHEAGARQRREHRLVEAFVAPFLRPAQDGRRGQLGAIVADHRMRLAAQPDQPRQFARNPNARQRRVDYQREAFPRLIVDHAQDAEATAARQRVGNEVERPTLVQPVRQQHRRPSA